jgi:predicted MFS family arabinose efflux permease
LASQTLHGITFGVWYVALVETVQADAPEEVRASAQSAVLAIMSVGMITGYVAGGRLLEDFDGATMYHVAAAASAVAVALYVVLGLRRPTARPA